MFECSLMRPPWRWRWIRYGPRSSTALTEPGSAATVAAAVGSTRQKVNYHLKALEAHGLVELAEEPAWGGVAERFVRRAGRGTDLVVAPDVLQSVAIDPSEVADRLSAAYLIR